MSGGQVDAAEKSRTCGTTRRSPGPNLAGSRANYILNAEGMGDVSPPFTPQPASQRVCGRWAMVKASLPSGVGRGHGEPIPCAAAAGFSPPRNQPGCRPGGAWLASPGWEGSGDDGEGADREGAELGDARWRSGEPGAVRRQLVEAGEVLHDRDAGREQQAVCRSGEVVDVVDTLKGGRLLIR